MEYNVPTKVGTEFSLRKIPSPQGRHTLIIIVAMKLIALLFLFNLQVTASVYSQRISLTASNTPLRDVLQSVRKQSGYSFFVESDNLRDSKPVNLHLWDNSVPEALDKIFENQPFTYTIQNNVIVVTRKERTNLSGADFLTFDSGAPDSTKVVYVQGSVRDDKGQPLVGVSVRVKGSGTGTVTKPDGTYTLKTNAAATLIFSYIGYLSREIKAQQGEIDVVLKQLNTALDQVQVIAYGTTTKRFSTGNIGTVSAEVIEKQPVSNPLLALQGRVPGLFIQQTTGLSAGNVTVNIQGINSLAQGTAPFFVVDGVPYPSVNINPSLMGSAIVGAGGSTLTYINPNDIESITVLKDADATSIYGSRAANGAILITTKKGKAGSTRVEANLQTGWGKVPFRLKMMNTKDYLDLRKEAKKNDNLPISSSDYDINGTWDSTRYTNWQKELVGGTSHFTNLQASVSGGSENTQFLVKTGYLKETTVYPGTMGDNKVNVHFNLNHRSSSHKFNINFTGTYLQDDNTLAITDLMSKAVIIPPNAPALYKSDGTLNWEQIPGTNTYSFNNPLSYQLQTYKGSTSNLVGGGDIGYVILPGLRFHANIGYNKIQSNESVLVPQSASNPGIIANRRAAISGNKSITSWIIEPQINYKRTYRRSNFDILIGSSFQETRSSSIAIAGTGFTSDAQIQNLQSAPNVFVTTLLQSKYRYTGFFSRLVYNYNDKYILSLAGRRDGSSRFGPANRFTNFYSVSGAWLFSDEQSIKDAIGVLSLGKLRVSYGTTGNDQIEDYSYLTLYNNVPVDIPYQAVVGLQPTGHSNPYLQWELTKKFNLGFDLGFFNNQILFTGNFYINRSSNQLIGYPLGYITGFPYINKNIDATIQNKGIELQIDANPIKSSKFSWDIAANLTIPQNKLLRFPDLDKSSLSNTYVVGKSINIAKVYPFLGVDPQTGLYIFQTADGKPTSDPSYITDPILAINLDPQYYGNITNTFSAYGFTLNFSIQFAKKTGPTNRYYLTSGPAGRMNNMPTVLNDRWKNIGDVSTYEKASTTSSSSYSALLNSTAYYEDASFIKLKNISLYYTLPQQWIKRLKINSCSVFAQAQNLFTITNFFGTDPETSYITVLPPLRMVSTGLNISL